MHVDPNAPVDRVFWQQRRTAAPSALEGFIWGSVGLVMVAAMLLAGLAIIATILMLGLKLFTFAWR